jgi:hypothetical protein
MCEKNPNNGHESQVDMKKEEKCDMFLDAKKNLEGAALEPPPPLRV